MTRQTKPLKPLIYVFCEGESEQAYADFLKKRFQDVVVVRIPKKSGLFKEADAKFQKDTKYRDYAEVTNEIWFFFDVEAGDADKWDARIKIINGIQQSMSRRGDPYDNAVAENFFSCLKCELIHLTRFRTRREAENAIFTYIECFYNAVRPHSGAGWLSPNAFEIRLRALSAA